MRFQITLSLIGSDQVLPFNYQYEMQAWIYKIFQQANPAFASFLHEVGYSAAHSAKRFKLFCFSNLYVSQSKRLPEGLRVLCPTVSFYIGFYTDQAVETFVQGLFMHQEGSIGNAKHRIQFVVSAVEAMSLQLAGDEATLKTLSPLVISRNNERGYEDYLNPQEDKEDYLHLFINNLVDKYAASGHSIPVSWQDFPFALDLIGNRAPTSKLITLKANTEKAEQIKGYHFAFRLTAPQALIQLGLLAGFGAQNAQGFGFCKEKAPQS
ncbi:MAG TPA: CRISPR-associated endoribonuclease Cas6 [Microscillaceae bacterium]|nr:CRISPR-associated endoribonuclease Cas6 [Microscillaceae bacterium]